MDTDVVKVGIDKQRSGAKPARRLADDGGLFPMLCSRTALLAASLLAVGAGPLHAQAPTAPAPPAGPAPPAQVQPAAPPTAQPPAAPQPPSAQAADAFGEEVMLNEKTILYMNGNANWDSAFETLIDTFKQLNTFLDRQGLKPNGPSMTIYTSTDDTGFSFQAAIPLAEEPKNPPSGDLAVGKSPSGRALKFVHRGSYDAMDSTYEAITNHLDEKRLEAKDVLIEEYATDPVTTPEDQLVIVVLVPIK
jgi:effector-binding domain-containing protein